MKEFWKLALKEGAGHLKDEVANQVIKLDVDGRAESESALTSNKFAR